MWPLVEGEERLRNNCLKLRAKVEDYLDSLPPPHLKSGLLTMNTMGKEYLIPPSQKNPLVIVLLLATCDIPRVNQKLYEIIVGFMREFFDKPVPPFRFYVEGRVSY